ncbi:hypothetical protein T492DRAFT_1129227 [Pavlovales sp. CCMP2436]|nr:hypothetical protein T492DRAFT_1129227 [Pavlovales sp. CCMP2436]
MYKNVICDFRRPEHETHETKIFQYWKGSRQRKPMNGYSHYMPYADPGRSFDLVGYLIVAPSLVRARKTRVLNLASKPNGWETPPRDKDNRPASEDPTNYRRWAMVHIRTRDRENTKAGWLTHITRPGIGATTTHPKRSHQEPMGAQRTPVGKDAGDRRKWW